MIQRIQTVYLVLTLFCTALLLYFPLLTITITQDGQSVGGTVGAYGFQLTDVPSAVGESVFPASKRGVDAPIYLFVIVLMALSVAAILGYKNRRRQLVICRLNMVGHLLSVAAFYGFYYAGQPFLEKAINEGESSAVAVEFATATGFFLLIPTLPLLWLALRGIKRDEALLQSVERFRR